MKTSAKLSIALIATPVALCLLSGCRSVRTAAGFATSGVPTPPPTRTVEVFVHALPSANLSSRGTPQPVKACVMQLKNPAWRPSPSLEGMPCSSITDDPDVLSVVRVVLAPGQIHRQTVVLDAGERRTMLVAAEFQQPAPGKDMLPLMVEPGGETEFRINLVHRAVTYTARLSYDSKD